MASWDTFLQDQQEAAYYKDIQSQLAAKRASDEAVYPQEDLLFNALERCALDNVKVVILGQDPYHGEGQAHGLSFSVPNGVAIPPSLKNIYKELANSIPGFSIPEHGCIESWAQQGVLLLNTVLTVTKGQAHSHANIVGHTLTTKILETVAQAQPNVVFMLWGAHAQKFAKQIRQIDCKHHLILKAPHPSPLSAHRGFIGCHHFSHANEWLVKKGLTPIDWQV